MGDGIASTESAFSRRGFVKALGAVAGLAVFGGQSSALAKNRGGTIPPHLRLPLQPFTVELLDENRGNWQFRDWAGQHLYLKGPISALAFAEGPRPAVAVRLAYLCCDPEFPRDLNHAVLSMATPAATETGRQGFRIREPYFSCGFSVREAGNAEWECTLDDILLGPATSGDRYVEALYLFAGGRGHLIWLAPPQAKPGPQIRLLTNRVGNVFLENEPARVTIAGLRPGPEREVDLAIHAVSYDTRMPVWHGAVHLAFEAGRPALHSVDLPLKDCGIFALTVEGHGQPVAGLRICRNPVPRRINPEMSSVGINIFQQQIWWYAFQVPLMAAAGVHWIRPWVQWENTWATQEPASGRWDFRALDAALRRMGAHGMRYQNMFYAAPTWVAGDAVPPMTKRGLNEWAEYVGKVVSRYRRRIRYHEIWNEPPNDGVDAEHYLAMLRVAWQTAKRADPSCVVLGLSERDGGSLSWLKAVCDGGAGAYMDAATIHIYAPPSDFLCEAWRRQRVLEQHHINRLWINEMGTTAYDFNPGYSKKYDCSERQQAEVLVKDFAQARVLDPQMKTFWFCTYDPRDAAHRSGWTRDAGIGVLYLGFLPKLAFAALAGFSKMVDGRRCLGAVRDAGGGLCQVSFEGPVAVAWSEGGGGAGAVPAIRLGCLPEEKIRVRDMFTNEICSGNATGVVLDFSRGPFYVEGSAHMAELAAAELARRAAATAAEAAVRVEPGELALGARRTGTIALTVPPGSRVSVGARPSPEISAHLASAGALGEGQIVVKVLRKSRRILGVVEVHAALPPGAIGAPHQVSVLRSIPVSANGGPNLLANGGFDQKGCGRASSLPAGWSPQGNSIFALNTRMGHTVPGCLQLDAPFSLRLVQWGVRPKRGQPLHLRFWVKTESLAGCRVSVDLAWFSGGNKWIETWCLAQTGDPKVPGFHREVQKVLPGHWQAIAGSGHIPSGTSSGWVPVGVTMPSMPPGAAVAAFFINAKGGGRGTIYFDDVDLWQPLRH